MTAIQETELDERVARIVSTLLREQHVDSWLTSAEAAAHLRMSKHHFLRVCRRGDGPPACGESRMQRWRRSLLDTWQENRSDGRATKPTSARGNVIVGRAQAGDTPPSS